MAYENLALELPPTSLSPEEARPYLAYFLRWMVDFFEQTRVAYRDEPAFRAMFVDELFRLFPEMLFTMQQDGVVERAAGQVMNVERAIIVDHGLYGLQLFAKASAVSYVLGRMTVAPRKGIFGWLTKAIDALLESILSTIPGGGAIKEVKEFLEVAVDWATSD